MNHTIKDAKRLRQLQQDKLLPNDAVLTTFGDAIDALNKALQWECRQTANLEAQRWRDDFATATKTPFQKISSIIKPNAPINFTADQMRQQWADTWCPNDHNSDQLTDAWDNHANDAQLGPLPGGNASLPDYFDLHDIMVDAKGSAGWDGWTSHETQTIAKHFPQATEELVQLWIDTTQAAPFAHANSGDDPTIAAVYDAIHRTRTVGIPKGDNDTRPISIASTLVRCWHRALLQKLPHLPDDQWAGQPGVSVATATSHWLLANKACGAELDLSRAFDTIDHKVGLHALTRAGVPTNVATLLALSWRAERICVVKSKPSIPITPTRGIPQGCPASPFILACVLRPWSAIIQHAVPTAHTWLFVDDRSLGISVTGSNDPQQDLQSALQVTTHFDTSIGLVENASKRQLWGPNHATTVEHLGTTVQPLNKKAEIRPRQGFTKAEDLIAKLARLPGGYALRFQTALYYIRPLFTWCAPLHHQPPKKLEGNMFQALTQRRASWWCQRRFWCDNLVVHPLFAATTQALKAIKPLNFLSPHMTHSITKHLRYLRLKWTLTSADYGIAAQLPTNADDELRQRVSDYNDNQPDDQQLPPSVFWTASNFGQHVLRYLMRRSLLNAIPTSRNDHQGHTRVDIDAQSNTVWSKWRKSLSNHDRAILNVWRSGASRTPTRRYYRPNSDDHNNNTACPYCQHEYASTRHFWAECPAFHAMRQQLSRQHNIPHGWWWQQPRITSKSRWITYNAGETTTIRANRQIAACKLGIHILDRLANNKPTTTNEISNDAAQRRTTKATLTAQHLTQHNAAHRRRRSKRHSTTQPSVAQRRRRSQDAAPPTSDNDVVFSSGVAQPFYASLTCHPGVQFHSFAGVQLQPQPQPLPDAGGILHWRSYQDYLPSPVHDTTPTFLLRCCPALLRLADLSPRRSISPFRKCTTSTTTTTTTRRRWISSLAIIPRLLAVASLGWTRQSLLEQLRNEQRGLT